MKKIFTFFAALTMVMSMFAATETVYFVNANDWSGNITVHAWGGSAADTQWPGLPATKLTEKIGGKDVWSFSAEAGAYKNVIFTNKGDNGGNQTADLLWTAGKYFVKDDWYTKEEVENALCQFSGEIEQLPPIYSAIKEKASSLLKYSTDGILNFYKLFTEEIIEHYADENTFLNLLIPSSILSDKSCVDLRKHILKNYKLVSIKVVPEGVDVVDAQQSLCAILIDKATKTTKIQMFKDFYHLPKSLSELNLTDIKSFSEDWNILPLYTNRQK